MKKRSRMGAASFLYEKGRLYPENAIHHSLLESLAFGKRRKNNVQADKSSMNWEWTT